MKDAVLTVRVPAEIKEKYSRLAKATNRSRSFLLNEALEFYLRVNEWQVMETKSAVEYADSPGARWIDHEDIKKEWEDRLARQD